MEDSVAKDYASQLGDLKMNSKPMINVLTMMAEDHIRSAPIVVQTIERHLNRVQPGLKLPTLYLIDSIVKNVKKDYINLFTQNIVSTFSGVFEKVLLSKVDEKVKQQMFKLRQTWNDVFPMRKLYAIDVRCHQLDKNWPISAVPSSNPPSIHVNPKFLAPSRSPSSNSPGSSTSAVSPEICPLVIPLPPPVGDVTEAQMREKLLLKQKELLELQQKKIELELMQTKAALETKRLEEIETTMTMEKMLLQQAEIAKGKTEVAHNILSSYPGSGPSTTGSTTTMAPSVSIAPAVNDPRLNRQMENKAKSVPVVLESKSKTRSPSTGKTKLEESPVKHIAKTFQNSVPKLSSKPLIEIIDPIVPVHVDHRKMKPDVIEINMFDEKKHRIPKRSIRRVNDKDTVEKDKSIRKDRKSRERGSKDRSRTPDRKRSSSPKDKKISLKDKLKRRKADNKDPEEQFLGVMKLIQQDLIVSNLNIIEANDIDMRKGQLMSMNEVNSQLLPNPWVGATEPTRDVTPSVSISPTVNDPRLNRPMENKTKSVPAVFESKSRSFLMRKSKTEDAPVKQIVKTNVPKHSSKLSKSFCDKLIDPIVPISVLVDSSKKKSDNEKIKMFDEKKHRNSKRSVSRENDKDNVEKGKDKKFRERGSKDRSHSPDRKRSTSSSKDKNSPSKDNKMKRRKTDQDSEDQYLDAMKPIQQDFVGNNPQIIETKDIDMRKGQQMQMSEVNSQLIPNPWAGGAPNQGPWVSDSNVGIPIFPGVSNAWGMNLPTGPWDVQLPGPKGPNPFEEALMPRIDDMIPPVNEMELHAAERDTASSIPIDKVMRELRFYGDTALILMGGMADEPKEISFQRDSKSRTIYINGKPLEITLGETKHFELNRKSHALKLGAPTRELYIDGRHYEICFGGPSVRIHIDNRVHNFELSGPPPQVELGKVSRYDLLAGRVNLVIDSVKQVNLYLDEKPQKIDLFSEPVILRFCDNFRTVLLNGRPFLTNFGSVQPFTVTIPKSGVKHYLRFSALSPSSEKALSHYIRTKMGIGMMEMDDSNSDGYGPFRGRGRGRGGRGRGGFRGGPRSTRPMEFSDRNHLDMLNNFQSQRVLSDDDNRRFQSNNHHSYENEQVRDPGGEDPTEEASDGLPDITNILALATRLGFLNSLNNSSNSNDDNNEEQKPEPETTLVEEPELENKSEKPTVPPLETVDVSLVSDVKDNLKERREKLIDQMWTGVQCASCGLRFPPDQTVRYAQHLDWHFRQNRRDKANTKKAQSRKWYYDLSDWIQFEEIEDLEERAESLFEMQEEAKNEVKSPTGVVNAEVYTVLASGHEGATCPQCGEKFSSYFDEEKEEWRLKDALLDESEDEPSKPYHPSCHQDYLKSLTEESVMDVDSSECVTDLRDSSQSQSTEGEENKPSQEEEDDEEVLILKEGKKEIVLMEIDVEDEEHLSDKDECTNEKSKKETEIELNDENISQSVNANSNNNIVSENLLTDKTPVPSYSVLSKPVSSPIVINDDDSSSNFLPGICEDSTDGVFGFALSSGRRERSESPVAVEDKKIIYKSMEFDFPTIKVESVDEPEEVYEPPDFTFSQSEGPISQEFLELSDSEVVAGSKIEEPTPLEKSMTEPVNIDLTCDDDSMDDEVDGGGHLPMGQTTAIDGNLTQEVNAQIVFAPPTKIRINISGMDLSSISPKSKRGEDSSPARDNNSNDTDKGLMVSNDAKKSPVIIDDNDSENNKQNAEIVFTEEMKRLKPRLVGRKLTNYPPKKVGREESGLCVIC